MKHALSIYLIAGNEEAYIGRCIDSFKPIAEEIVVCMARGSVTPDKTEEIALGRGARVVHYENQKKDWPHIDDFATARNVALNACKNEWAMWVDADDTMGEGAGEAIEQGIDEAIKSNRNLVAFRYAVINAGLNPLREMVSRKGTCTWQNRVHEALVCNTAEPAFAIDKIVRVHQPHGYKKESAERNFRILNDSLISASTNLYYKQQEEFLSGKYAECIQTSLTALRFDDLIDTLKYDVLCNLGRCAEQKDRLNWLGQAISCQPDRREAYYYMALTHAERGHWKYCHSVCRAGMILNKPKEHYWNLVESIYKWQLLDIYHTACVAYGENEEAEKIKKQGWPAPKISIIHATKGRPQIAWQRRVQWLTLAKNPLEIEWLFMVDHDEAVNYTAHQAIRVNPGGIVNAWNEGAKQAKSEIIIQMSDDWTPPRDWDALISSRIGTTSDSKVLAVSDGLRKDKLLCMSILTKKRLEEQGGYMFHPDYQESDGIYGDNEFTDRAYSDGVIVEARDLVFKHENAMFNGGTPDELLKTHNKPEHYAKGKEIYERRTKNS